MAFAQDDEIEEIVVTGIRSSLKAAIDTKRDADSLIEVINAEDIGKLPDQNLAEVLENVTGIQITREAGVGTGVQIRGTGANRTEFNGVSTVGSGAGRSGIDFEDVAASIISSVEVVKAPEASTIEGSVGGTINLKTIRPLDLRETLAAVRIQGEDSSLQDGGGLSPRFSGTWGDSWDTDVGRIGVVLSGSWTEQDVRAFRPRVDRDNFIGSGSGSASAQEEFDFLPIQFLIQDYDNFDYETKNFAGSLEWQLNDNVKFYLDTIINDQERLQEGYRVQASGVSDLRALHAPDTFETVNFGAGLGSIEAALTGTIPVQSDFSDGNLRASTDTSSRESESEIFRLGADWNWERFTGSVEFAISSNDTKNPNFSTTLNFLNPNVDHTKVDGDGDLVNEDGTPFIYDLRGGSLTWRIAQEGESDFAPTEGQLLEEENYVLRDINLAQDTSDNDEDAFRMDVTYDLDWEGIKTVALGYRYNKSTSVNNDIRENASFRKLINSPTGDKYESILSRIPGNYNEADGRALFVDTLLIIDPTQVNANPGGALDLLNAAVTETNADIEAMVNADSSLSDDEKAAEIARLRHAPIDSPSSAVDSFYDIEEETHALYAQLNFEGGIYRANAGFRYVQTDLNSSAITAVEMTDPGTGATSTMILPRNSNADYGFWLPRFNLVADVRDDLLVRLSWSKDIRRPDFDDLSLATSFDTSPNPAVEIGNPGLAPEEVESFDISIEWYFAEGAVASIGLFQKKRTGLFVESTDDAYQDPVTNERDITDPCEDGGVFNPIADYGALNFANGMIGVGVCVPADTTVNGAGETTQRGVELAFQYDLSEFEDSLGWASGFGFAANYTNQEFLGGDTFLNPTTRANTVFTALGNPNYRLRAPLIDLSENAYNITVYYEKYGLSARMRYTWREAYRSDDFGSTSSLPWGFPVIQDDRGQLNASVSYAVNDNLDVGIEAVNLTEAEVEQYCVNEGALLCFQGFTDRRITFGASYRF